MKKHGYTFKETRTILIVLVWILIAVLVTVSFAAYTNSGYKKGVVSTNGSSAMFSSNYLLQYSMGTTEYSTYTLSFPKRENANGTVNIELYIYNHAPDDPNKPNPKNITYTLNMKATVKSGTSGSLSNGYAVNSNAFTNDGAAKTMELTEQKLLGGTLRYNKYTITVPYADLDKVCLTVVATPDTENAKTAAGNKILARELYTATYSTEAGDSFSWNGRLFDMPGTPTQENQSTNYTAFNYEISGMGQGLVTVKWDSAFVEMDPFFKSEIAAKPGTVLTENSLQFAVDSNTRNHYLIQFYRKNIPAPNETWNMVKEKFVFEKQKAISLAIEPASEAQE